MKVALPQLLIVKCKLISIACLKTTQALTTEVDAEKAVRVAEEGTLNPDSWAKHVLCTRINTCGAGLIHSRWCWRLCWEGQAEKCFSWKGWAEPRPAGAVGLGLICNSGFCFWHCLEAGRRSYVATRNKNRLGINFKSIFLLFCLNKKLTGDAWAAVNNKDAGKSPYVCGYVYSAADKAGLYS